MVLEIDPNGPASEQQVADVEAQLDIRFPEPYRTWLKHTGGGELTEDVVIPGTEENGLLSEIDGVDDLLVAQEVARNKVVPSDYVVISIGHGGSLALRVRGGDEGSVWWVDYDLADELAIDEPGEQMMRRLADDFDSFLALFP